MQKISKALDAFGNFLLRNCRKTSFIIVVMGGLILLAYFGNVPAVGTALFLAVMWGRFTVYAEQLKAKEKKNDTTH